MFLLYASNYCFPTSDENFLALFEFRRFFWNWGGGGGQPLPKFQTPRGFVSLFEKIYEGEPIITVISNIGEMHKFLMRLLSICIKVRTYA